MLQVIEWILIMVILICAISAKFFNRGDLCLVSEHVRCYYQYVLTINR